MQRCLLPCALVGCAAAHAAPFLAIGDNAELFVTATTGVRYEDNVLLTENNTVDDVVFQFTPGLELLFGKGSQISGSFVAQQKFERYADNDQLNANLPAFFFNGSYDQAKLKVNTNASWQRVQQNSRNVLNAATLTRRDLFNAGVNAELAVTEKSKVGAGFSTSDTDYRTAGFTDSTSYTVPVNYYFAVTEKVDLSAGVRYRETYIDGGSDYQDTYYNIGARGEFTSKLTGRFSIGYTDRSPDVGKSQSLLGLDFDLAYALSPKTNLALVVSNDFDSSSSGGTSQKVISIGLRATTQINSQLTAQAGVSYENADYSSGRSDDYVVFNLSGSYAFNQHISAVLAYSFQNNDSSTSGLSYTANVISLSAVFRY